MLTRLLNILGISIRKPRRAICGAVMAEYLPILSIGVLVGLAGVQSYGPALQQHVGEMASQLASNYYQGWFYPKETAGLAPIGGGSGSGGSGGPSAGEGSDGQDGSGGESEDGGVGGIGGDDDNPDSEDPFNPNPGGGQSCAADTGGGSGDPLSSPSASSVASTNTAFGNPIDIGTGNKFQREFDYRHAGVTPLVFERYYNSLQSPIRSALGYGWRHSYSRQLLLPRLPAKPEDVTATVTPPRPSPHSNTLKMLRDDGSVYVFNQDGKHWQGDGVVDQLIEAGDGWLYTTVNGVVEHYNSLGQLQDVRYPNGISHTLTYDDAARLASITDSRGPALQLHYKQVWLSRVTLPDGDQLRFQYSDTGNLHGYQRSGLGLWASVSAVFTDNTATYHYEDSRFAHALTGLTDAEGQRYATWAYDHLGRAVLSQHGEGAEKLTFDYRDDGTVAMTNAAGRTTVFHLEAARPGYRRLVRADGQATPTCPETRQNHRYNPQGFLKLAVDANGQATSYTRNERGLVEQREDGLAKHAGQWLPEEGARRIEHQWHPDLPLVTQATYSTYIIGEWQTYLKREFHYSDAGRLLTRTDTDLSQQEQPYRTYGQQRTWRYSYYFTQDNLAQPKEVEINGPLPARDDGSDDITHIAYNRDGLIESITNPLGQTTRLTAYNRHAQLTQAQLPNGIEVSLTYDAYQHLDTLTRRGGDLAETIDLDIDRNGLLQKLTLPDGSWQQFDYNAARQLTGVVNYRGEMLSITPSPVSGQWQEKTAYDSHGLPVRQFDRQLDSLGRVISVLGQYGQRTDIRYTKGGQLLSMRKEGNDQPSLQQYDGLGRLTQTLNALQGKTIIDYSLQGRVASITDAEGHQTRYFYNGFGDIVMMQSPDTGVLLHHYDSAGNKIRTQGGATLAEASTVRASTEYRHDLASRLVAIDYPDTGNDVAYSYDSTDAEHGRGIGQLTHIKDASGTIDYSYDFLGRLTNEVRAFTLNGQTANFSVGYYYNRKGLLDYIQLPNGDRQRFSYDRERVSKIYYQRSGFRQTIIDKVVYALGDTPAAWRYGNGAEASVNYDLDGRLTRQYLKNTQFDALLRQQNYHYDTRNQIELIDTHGMVGEPSTHYRYDALARLVAETPAEDRLPTKEYKYDAVGNRLAQHLSLGDQQVSISSDYSIKSSHIKTYGGTQLLLSGNGNTLIESHPRLDRRYVYNQINQLVAVYVNRRLKSTYAYNSLGQRTHKLAMTEQGPKHTVFHYNYDGQLLGETIWSPRDGVQSNRFYLWWQRMPVAMIDQQAEQVPIITYLHSDHLNTPRLATNQDQTAVWQWQSDAFGVGLPDEDPDGDGTFTNLNLRFAGQYFDAESGLHYNYHRYYDPETGRYTQSDPIGIMGGANTFAYAMANPVANTDPWGLFLFAFDGTGNDQGNRATFTNVTHLQNYYAQGYSVDDFFYQPGVGTDGDIWDDVLGGGAGLGSRERVDKALTRIGTLLENDSWDRVIDIVGFSRGAAAAREFSNEVFERIDSDGWGGLVTDCNPINIRFMGLFDTVGSMGLAGNGTDIGYDFSIDSRIGHVAQAVALNEHRFLFPLSSVSPVAGASITSGNVVERGFIGAHSDVGGGYADSDLSDVALQWMYQQAVNAGVSLGPLSAEHQAVTGPVIHDERRADGFMGAIHPDDGDRSIYYPNDPFSTPNRQCERRERGQCVQWEPIDPAERQKTAPQFPDLSDMINENYQGNRRGTVDMDQYRQWLQSNVGITVN
ncbi:DUF2235 domain-containing protein [uncultured Zhongshania sp.]|uniref:phospholipase effector Tle1 domain-containing protein n=1 Tax=uncultured Zhongshania sp. TaxID=1642288 RepID=UPI0030DAAEC3